MRSAMWLIPLMVAAPAMAQVQAQAPSSASAAPPSLIREGVTEKLTEHVWAIPDGSAPLVPNVGIVVGDKAVLVIDTGMGTRNAEVVLKEVARVGRGKPIYLVTTHVHPELDMGAHAFPSDSRLIRSKVFGDQLDREGFRIISIMSSFMISRLTCSKRRKSSRAKVVPWRLLKD